VINNPEIEEDTLYNASPEHSKTIVKTQDSEIIDILHGEIYSLKNMMDQKDHLLEKMSYVFKEKDTMITELKKQLHETSYDDTKYERKKEFIHTKKTFQPSPERKGSGVESERSLHSLVHLMQKTHKEQMQREKRFIDEKECLSHSNSESLSGSSTTSIVAKCYDKSWKKNHNYEPEYDENQSDFEREDGLEDL